MTGFTLDVGALIALDRDDRRVIAMLTRAAERGLRIVVPATALAQALRNPTRQARLSRLVRQASTSMVALDASAAQGVGLLLARTATSDVVDAHVAICALRTGTAVVTSDPGDMERLAPGLRIVSL